MKNLLKLNNLYLLAFGIFIFAGSCFAEETNSSPVHINADKLEYNSEEKVLYLRGNVVVRHPEGMLVADNATVYQAIEKKEENKKKDEKKNKMGNIKRIVAVGNVKMTSKDAVTVSDKAVWDGENQTITLTGGPPIAKQPAGYIRADRIIYDIETGNITFHPQPHIIFEIDADAKSKFLE